jgi:hypothetical protein
VHCSKTAQVHSKMESTIPCLALQRAFARFSRFFRDYALA